MGERGLFPQVEYPIIFGHEGGGIVRAIGSEVEYEGLGVGDTVICCYNYCGHCKPCTGGRFAACANHAARNIVGLRPDGTTPYELNDGRPARFQFYGQSSFARMAVVSGVSVVKCPYAQSLPVYCALGCGFQTGAGTIMNALKPRVDQSVAILGIGGVGMTAIMGAKALGVQKIVAVDRFKEKLDLARQFGATHTVDTQARPDIAEAVHELTDGGADIVVECAGAPPLLEALLDSAAVEGTCVTLGVPPIGWTLPVRPLDMVLESKTLRGIIQGESVSREVRDGVLLKEPLLVATADSDTTQFLPRLMHLSQEGKFPIDHLCKVYPMSDLDKCLDDARSGVVSPIDAQRDLTSVNEDEPLTFSSAFRQTVKPVLQWD